MSVSKAKTSQAPIIRLPLDNKLSPTWRWARSDYNSKHCNMSPLLMHAHMWTYCKLYIKYYLLLCANTRKQTTIHTKWNHPSSVKKQRGDHARKPVPNVVHVLLMREEQNNAVGINNVKQLQLFTQLSKRGGQQIILSSVRRVTIVHCTPAQYCTRPDTHSLHFLITSSPSSCGGDFVILQWQNSFCFRLGLVRSCHQQLCFSCWD